MTLDCRSYGQNSLTVEGFDALAEQALASPIRHRSGSFKIFTGAGYNLMPETERQTSGNLPLLLHGVTNDQPGQERDAVVLFINEHAGITGIGVPPKDHRSFRHIREAIEERQHRKGGLVAS